MGATIRSYHATVIENGEALSERVVLRDGVPVALEMPEDWTAADITLKGSRSADGTLYDVYDADGNEVTLTVGADRFVVLNPADYAGFGSIQLRSGTTASPVNQGADRTLFVIYKEM